MLGLGLGLNKRNSAIGSVPFKSDLVQYTKTAIDGVLIDKVGASGSEVGREYQGGAYLAGDGTRELKWVDYPSELFTYIDHVTGLEVGDGTDASGVWLIPTNGVDSLTIDGYTYNFEGTNNDTKCIGLNRTTGLRKIAEIQNATGSDRVSTDAVRSGLDDYGYTVSKALGKNLFDKSVRNLDTYVNTSGGLSNSGTSDTTDYILVDELTNYFKTDVRAGALYDSSMVFISYYNNVNDITFTTPSNTKYVRFTVNKTSTDTAQLEQGTTATAYETYIGYFYDSALTEPVPQGVKSETANGKSGFYTADSTPSYADADFSGGLKANIDVNYGSFTANGTNNYLDTGIVPTQSTVMKVWGKWNNLSNLGSMGCNNGSVGDYYFGTTTGPNYRLDFGSASFTGGTPDTDCHVFEVANGELFIDDTKELGTSGQSVGTPSLSLYLLDQNGAFSNPNDFTIFKAEIIHSGSTHIWDFNADSDEKVVYTIDGALQSTPTISGTVTSGQWGTDGIVRQQTTKYSVFTADQLKTANNWYSALGVPQVLAIADLANVQDSVEFIAKDPWKQLLYSRSMSQIDELPKVMKYMKLNELYMVQTAEGSGEYETYAVAEGPLYVPKEGVVID